MKRLILILTVLTSGVINTNAQDLSSQVPTDKKYNKDIVDETYGIRMYEPLNVALGGDSVRMDANGYAADGWREDFYTDGTMLHRGYYIEGQLKVYKNYYPNGQLEREFKSIDGFRSQVTLYYSDGTVKSTVKYMEGAPLIWTDYYPNGNMEYYEEYHKSFTYHIAKKSFYESGQAESLFILVNKKKLDYTQDDYYNSGAQKVKGTLRFDKKMYDYYRTGTWLYYDESGSVSKKETYQGGQLKN